MDEVDFVFAFPVPPSADARVKPGLGQLSREIAFKRESAESVPVAPDDFAEQAKRAEFHGRAVLGYEPKPEKVEVVAYSVAEVLRKGLSGLIWGLSPHSSDGRCRDVPYNGELRLDRTLLSVFAALQIRTVISANRLRKGAVCPLVGIIW